MKKYIIISGIMLAYLVASLADIFTSSLSVIFSFNSWTLILVPIDIWLSTRKIRQKNLTNKTVSLKFVAAFWLISLTVYYTLLFVFIIAYLYNGDFRGILWNLDTFTVVPILLLPMALLIFASFKLAKTYYSEKVNFIKRVMSFLSKNQWIFLGVTLAAVNTVWILRFCFDLFIGDASELLYMIAIHSFVAISIVYGTLQLEKQARPVKFAVKYCLTFIIWFVVFETLYNFAANVLKINALYWILVSNDILQFVESAIFHTAQIVVVITAMAVKCIYLSQEKKKQQIIQ